MISENIRNCFIASIHPPPDLTSKQNRQSFKFGFRDYVRQPNLKFYSLSVKFPKNPY